MLTVRRYLVTAHTLLAGRLSEVRAVELPATGVLRAIQGVSATYPDRRLLVYRARVLP